MYDGETTECGRYRLHIEPDHLATLKDWPDCYGQVGDFTQCRSDAQVGRPYWCNGRARKIYARDAWTWWQPPADVADEFVGDLHRTVTALAKWGWISVGVERLDGKDAYGRPIVAAQQWIGGVENELAHGTAESWHSTLRDIVGDLLAELEADV